MESNILPNPSPTGSTESFKQFQLGNLSPAKKADKAWGLSIATAIDSTVQTGVSNSYYWTRNSNFQVCRNYANGTIPMAPFMDQLDFNGKTNYANISWQCIMLGQRIVAGLVERWMARNEKVKVRCIDSLSVTQKDKEYQQLEFTIAKRKQLEQLQQASGVQLMPEEQGPTNRKQLDLWQSHVQKIPEEILFEIGINEAFHANGLYDVIKRKLLHDSVETGLVGTYTWMDEQGVVHVEPVKPENMIYSYSDYNDFRDTTWRGQVKSMKVSEIRVKYGVQFGGALTEEEMWKIAQSAKEYKLFDTLRWDNYWNSTLIRPYDEWNVDVIDFEFKTDDTEGYTETITKGNKSTILQKGKPEKLKDNQSYIEDKKWSIYRGVYIRVTRTLLEWGLKRNMIRPQDPKELGDCEFSYSFYMYQNRDMFNISVPRKIKEPLDNMIITRKRIEQIIAVMRPPGTLINHEAVQNLDYGLGDKNKDVDVIKLFNQTGNIYYRGRDAEGNPIGVPITDVPNAGFAPQLQALMELYNFHYGVLRDELGEDPNFMQKALQPRVTSGNVDAASQNAEFATDYMYDAVAQVLNDTARKVACLMKNSVVYGSQVYRELMDKEDVQSRIFSTVMELMPTQQELAKFENFLQTSLAANPLLSQYLDPFQLMRTAQENIKLAELYMRNAQEEMYEKEMQKAQANSQQQAQVQMQAAQAAEQEKRMTKDEEIKGEIVKAVKTGEAQSRNTALAGVMAIWQESMKSGVPVPAQILQLSDIVLKNVALPAMAQNDMILQQMQAQMDQGQQPQAMEAPEPEMAGEQEEPQQMEQQQQAAA